MFTYITSNINKIESAKKALLTHHIDFQHKDLELVEIQSANGLDIAMNKAKQAYSLINHAIVIADSTWEIPSLNGFPGPYLHDISKWLNNEDFLNLMRSKKDRSIFIGTILIYKDGNQEKAFLNSKKGKILEAETGTGKFAFDRIVTFRKDEKSLAECIDLGIDKFDDKSIIWDDFAKWYKISNIGNL
jgi:XTP/dITP diphosphohydrolase